MTSGKLVEKEWMQNRYKAVISTNALGMGIDKSDIRFIIHTQIPQSPIHYYQEIGRAGRDGKVAEIFLLFNPKDKDLPLSFINSARPSVDKYERVIKALKLEPLGEKQFMKATNLTQTQKCKMLYLCNYLGDANSKTCKICDSCLHNKNQFSMGK